MLKIRRSCDRLIFNMGIPIPGKDGLNIEMGPKLTAYSSLDELRAVESNYIQYGQFW